MSSPEGKGNFGDVACWPEPLPAALHAVDSRVPVLAGEEPPPGSKRVLGRTRAQDGVGGRAAAGVVGEARAAGRRGARGRDEGGRGSRHGNPGGGEAEAAARGTSGLSQGSPEVETRRGGTGRVQERDRRGRERGRAVNGSRSRYQLVPITYKDQPVK